MSPEYLGLVYLGALITGIFIGFPICFTLIILCIVFGTIGIGPQVFYLMVFQAIGMMTGGFLAAALMLPALVTSKNSNRALRSSFLVIEADTCMNRSAQR